MYMVQTRFILEIVKFLFILACQVLLNPDTVFLRIYLVISQKLDNLVVFSSFYKPSVLNNTEPVCFCVCLAKLVSL